MYKYDLFGIDKTSSEYKKIKSHCHQKAAEMLLDLCCANKGVYIKVGQHIAALDYLLPTEYVQTMKVLHSHAPSNKLEDVYKVISEDFKKKPKEIFLSVDPEPLGTASLAQVHKAFLHDGSVVAIKVQHPYVKNHAKVDMKSMEIMVKIVSLIFPEFKFQWLVDETKKNIPQELDFFNEGKNAEKVAKMFQCYPWLVVPKVRWDLTTSRVLTMDFVEGGQINDLEYINKNGLDRFEIADKLGKLYSRMIFIYGFVHSDPHPGNILLKKAEDGSCEIVLLDHGLYATLSKDLRVEYSQLWLSILNKDKQGMKTHSRNLGIEGDIYGLFACMISGRTWDSLMEGITRKKPSLKEKKIMQDILPTVLPKINEILECVNRQMILIFKTNDLMRGIEYTLNTSNRMASFKVMSCCCIRSVYGDKMDKARSIIDKLKIVATQYWLLFKINIYYAFLTINEVYRNTVSRNLCLYTQN
ncbi:uncharacterized aarF domain-containing protein kinase 1 isoform X4 [Agrilus planipennis]|nr:uncharacterized aarF domain-containing protein kinase 1 isoform X4 [Agrilus planipennis]